MNRREFVRRLEALSAAAACGAALPLSGCLGFYYVNSTVSGNRVLVPRRELGEGRFALVDVPRYALPLLLVRDERGGYTAVSTRCMHRGCQVEPAADRLVCPCHGSEYTHAGAVLKGPTRRPLQAFPVTVEGEALAIELPPAGEER